MSACGCMPKFFQRRKPCDLSGDDFAANVASFAVFGEVTGEGVYDFTVRTVAMCMLVYALARTAGSASLKFCRAPTKGRWHSVEDGNVRAASEWCATGFVSAIRSEIV